MQGAGLRWDSNRGGERQEKKQRSEDEDIPKVGVSEKYKSLHNFRTYQEWIVHLSPDVGPDAIDFTHDYTSLSQEERRDLIQKEESCFISSGFLQHAQISHSVMIIALYSFQYFPARYADLHVKV